MHNSPSEDEEEAEEEWVEEEVEEEARPRLTLERKFKCDQCDKAYCHSSDLNKVEENLSEQPPINRPPSLQTGQFSSPNRQNLYKFTYPNSIDLNKVFY